MNMRYSRFIKLTSDRDTPIYVLRDAVLMIEGFTFSNQAEQRYRNHIGARLTLRAGEYSESIVCIESVEDVFLMVEPEPRPARL